jgi:nucleoside 2-deoxyribosyltransferase
MAKVYIAAPWANRATARITGQQCEDRGIEITHKWWDFEGDFEEAEKMQSYAEMDFEGVRKADFLILLDLAKSEGKAVEQGIALALGKEIIAVGERGAHSKNVFHHLANYHWVADPWEAFDKLLELRGRKDVSQ